MLSINTNLSSLIAQNSMKSSSFKLDTAIERMTTGYKINHAKDNAANYSICTNMTTKIGSYMVAEDNALQGLDMINTASENLSLIEDKLMRLRALATQASNGTYGEQSLNAINAEAGALVDELGRTYSTAEYNGVKIFKGTAKIEIPDGVGVQPTATYSMRATNYGNFIDNPVTYTEEEIEAMLASGDIVALDNNVTSFTSGQKYLISDETQLARLATLVNSYKTGAGAIFILGADIDLSSVSNWTRIGTAYSSSFEGTFDGNGHVIKNLKISVNSTYCGLFGYTSGDSVIKNVGIEGGSVKGKNYVGSLVGYANSLITNCYATCSVEGENQVGGLVGNYSEPLSEMTSCYASGNVSGGNNVGGLVGYWGAYSSPITNCFASGNVTGDTLVGGLVGSTPQYTSTSTQINNSYAIGKVTGVSNVGGLVGKTGVAIKNSYATGSVDGVDAVGGLVGFYEAKDSRSITYSYANGSVTGDSFVGGLVGKVEKVSVSINIADCVSYSTVNGNDSDSTGSLLGGAVVTTDNSTFGTINVTGCQTLSSNNNTIGGSYMYASSTYTLLDTFDMSAMLAGIKVYKPEITSMTLQVGTSAPGSNQITFDMAFELDGFNSLSQIGIDTTTDFVGLADNLLAIVSAKQTEYGAVQNRLESALDEISTQYENLVSSRSTIRDADMSEVSSQYIQQQILQQASATLMSTANQSPAIALQLI